MSIHHLGDMSADEGYTLGAFAVILDADDRVLVSHRNDPDLWNLPGGRVQPGELPDAAVIREVREETGLEVEVVRLTGSMDAPMAESISCSRSGAASPAGRWWRRTKQIVTSGSRWMNLRSTRFRTGRPNSGCFAPQTGAHLSDIERAIRPGVVQDAR